MREKVAKKSRGFEGHDEAENSTSSSSEALPSNGHGLNNDEVFFAVALHLDHVTPHEAHHDAVTLAEYLLGSNQKLSHRVGHISESTLP